MDYCSPTAEGWEAELDCLADSERTVYPRSGHLSTVDRMQGRENPPARNRHPNHWETRPATLGKHPVVSLNLVNASVKSRVDFLEFTITKVRVRSELAYFAVNLISGRQPHFRDERNRPIRVYNVFVQEEEGENRPGYPGA